MQKSTFRYYFKRLGGVYITDKVVLFRRPLQLYSLATDSVIANFKNLDEAFAYSAGGKTLADIISEWKKIALPADRGGRGGGSGMGFSGSWPSAGGNLGPDETKADLPARMNVKLSGAARSYNEMLREFIKAHGDALEEHGVVVDIQGFVSKYRHGNAGSISGLTGTKNDIAIHNHPRDGWPNFSKEDVVNTALGSRRGIVAVSTKTGRDELSAKYAGTYSFVKGQHFDSAGFVKAINKAQLSGKDYNDAVSRWLRKNQKKYGYSYSFVKAK